MIRLFNVSLPGRTVLLALSDVFVVFAALLGALLVWARSGSAWMPYGTSLAQIGVISLIWMPCIYYYDLYDTSVLSSISDGMTRLLQVVGTACLALAVLYALFPGVGLSHSLLITWALLAGALLGAVRWIFSAISSAGTWSEGVVLFGDGPLAQQLSKEIGARPELGLRILGSVGIDDTAEGLKNLGGLEDLANVVQREKARHIVLTLTDRRGFMPIDDLLRLRSRGLPKRGGGNRDLHAVVKIVVPKELSDRERELYEELAEISGQDPREV